MIAWFSAIYPKLVYNLVFIEKTWRVGCGWGIRDLSAGRPRFTTVVSHVGGRDEYLLLYASYRLFESSVICSP